MCCGKNKNDSVATSPTVSTGAAPVWSWAPDPTWSPPRQLVTKPGTYTSHSTGPRASLHMGNRAGTARSSCLSATAFSHCLPQPGKIMTQQSITYQTDLYVKFSIHNPSTQ